MGVIMTPSDGIRKFPYYWAALITLGVVVLLTVTSIAIYTRATGHETSTSAAGHEITTSAKEHEITTIKDITPKVRQTGPLMAWTGQSEFGYTRVELWKTDGTSYLQDIVIQAAEKADSITTKVAIVKVPGEIQIKPDINTLFVSVEDGRDWDSSDRGVVASTGKDGMLKLFVIGMYRFRKPCDLTPDIGR